jgi:hypothetical protein
MSWKVVLVLLLGCQVLAIGSFLARIFWQLESSWLPPLPFAILSVLGTLLWCVESVQPRPGLTKLALRGVLLSFLAWSVSFLLLPFQNPSKSREKLRSEAGQNFQILVEKGRLPAPSSPEEVVIGQRHGVVTFRYRDAAGGQQDYYARRTLETVWIFEKPLEGKKVFSRQEE